MDDSKPSRQGHDTSGKDTSGGLIDVTGLDTRKMLSEVSGTGLDAALRRILGSGEASAGHNGFSNAI